MKNKFKPSDLKNFEENDYENLTFNEQKKFASKNFVLNYSPEVSAHLSKERMKKQWSYLLMIYLIIFTIAMFITLWFSGKCVLGFEKFCIVDLNPTTLNFLISVGFGKVIAVVWIIVKHLFPNENPNKK
jgi:hypothetical protein